MGYYLYLLIVTMASFVIATQADTARSVCITKCKGCVDVSETFKRVQCLTTCLAFGAGASAFQCINVNPTPDTRLATELATFQTEFFRIFATNDDSKVANLLEDDYSALPMGLVPSLGKTAAMNWYKEWLAVSAEQQQSEAAHIVNCGENDGYVWMYGTGKGFDQLNNEGNVVEHYGFHRMLKRYGPNNFKVYLDVIEEKLPA